MKFTLALSLLALLPSLVSSIRVPNADTPEFYLVSSSSTASANLLPVLMSGALGTPSSSSPAAKFYFYQGQLTLLDPAGGTPYRAFINETPASDCTPYGALEFAQSTSTSNKCAQFTGFQIQSDTENSQLGAQLVFNFAGAFYACAGNAVYWKNSAGVGPSGCNPVSLYTVPVV